MVITGSRLQDVKEVFISLFERTNKMGLDINEKKTKFFIVLRKLYNEYECVKIGTYNFEMLKYYTYLGTILTNKNEFSPQTGKRSTNRVYYALLPLLKSQSVLIAEKAIFCKTSGNIQSRIFDME